MESSKRSRTASKQLQAGPAPLASFEDLPSDELESPEDFDLFGEGAKMYDIQADNGTPDFRRTSGTPDSITISTTSTPQMESDCDSQFTLTPGDSFKDQSSKLRTGSLSSLSKEKNLCVKQDKGSAVSLNVCGTLEGQYEQRKSSWADIFHPHSSSSSKYESSMDPNKDMSVSLNPLSKKKSKSDQIKKEKSDIKPKEKGKFLSIFKVGKKASRNVQSPVSPVDFILPNTNQKPVPDSLKNIPVNEYVSQNIPIDSPNSLVNDSEGKENKEPKLVRVTKEAKNDLSSEKLDNSSKISGNVTTFMLQVNNIKEDESTYDKQNSILYMHGYVSPSDSSNPKGLTKPHLGSVEDDHESSESELTFDTQEPSPDAKDDDFEAEKLLAQDSSEVEDYPVFEIPPTVQETSKQVVTKSKQQRLEVTTIPIERPRSTTPINIAPLEAFIQSVSPSADRKVEKLKLSLPGDQFINKLKSPRKGSITKSWADFCESLHSPRFQKRIEVEAKKIHLNSPNHIVKEFSTSEDHELHGEKAESPGGQWATFDVHFEQDLKADGVGDRDHHFPKNEDCGLGIKTVSDNFSGHHKPCSEITRCVCECHFYGCEDRCLFAEVRNLDACGTLSDKISGLMDSKLSAKSCICSCHHKQVTLWSSSETKAKSTDPFHGYDATQSKTACSVEDQNF